MVSTDPNAATIEKQGGDRGSDFKIAGTALECDKLFFKIEGIWFKIKNIKKVHMYICIN